MRTVRIVSALVVLAAVLVGCRGGGRGMIDDLADGALRNVDQESAMLDEPSVQRQITGPLRPLEGIDANQQMRVLQIACKAKDIYELGEVRSMEEAVEEAGGMSRLPAAARKNATELAEKLVKLNKHPTLVGTFELTGDAYCAGS